MSDLLPCPLCDGVSALHENDWCEPHEWHVYCATMECGCHGPSRLNVEAAIAAWNRRTPASTVLPDRAPARDTPTSPNAIASIVETYTDILSPETARKVASRIRSISTSSGE